MPEKLEIKEDERGKLIELLKIPGAGQLNYVTVKPGAVRGNHYHTRKLEKFLVIEGDAKISSRNKEDGELKEYYVSGRSPEIIDLPANWTHNIKNTGLEEVKFLTWINEIFNPNDPDTYAEEI